MSQPPVSVPPPQGYPPNGHLNPKDASPPPPGNPPAQQQPYPPSQGYPLDGHSNQDASPSHQQQPYPPQGYPPPYARPFPQPQEQQISYPFLLGLGGFLVVLLLWLGYFLL